MQNLMYSKTNDLVGAIHDGEKGSSAREEQLTGWSVIRRRVGEQVALRCQQLLTHAHGLPVRVLHGRLELKRDEKALISQRFVLTSVHSFLNAEQQNKTLKLLLDLHGSYDRS